MAAHRVFGVSELLEQILLRLPTKDLLLSQRVCKTFCDTLKDSIHLQRALFMIAADEINDINAEYHSCGGQKWTVYTSQGSTTNPPTKREIEVVFNPLLVNRLQNLVPKDTMECFVGELNGALLCSHNWRRR